MTNKFITIDEYKAILKKEGIKYNWVEISKVKEGDSLGVYKDEALYLAYSNEENRS